MPETIIQVRLFTIGHLTLVSFIYQFMRTIVCHLIWIITYPLFHFDEQLINYSINIFLCSYMFLCRTMSPFLLSAV